MSKVYWLIHLYLRFSHLYSKYFFQKWIPSFGLITYFIQYFCSNLITRSILFNSKPCFNDWFNFLICTTYAFLSLEFNTSFCSLPISILSAKNGNSQRFSCSYFGYSTSNSNIPLPVLFNQLYVFQGLNHQLFPMQTHVPAVFGSFPLPWIPFPNISNMSMSLKSSLEIAHDLQPLLHIHRRCTQKLSLMVLAMLIQMLCKNVLGLICIASNINFGRFQIHKTSVAR